MSEDNQDEKEFDYDSVDYETHPSISLALEEARKRYSDEENRRGTIETKIGILISIDAIVISLIGSIAEWTIYALLSMILAVVSAALGLYIIWPKIYHRPGDDIGEIFGDAQLSKADFEKQYLNDYRKAISTNMGKNDRRYKYFKWCSKLTFASLLVVLIGRVQLL